MRIFITGGTGFIGQHLVKKLVELGHQAFVLIRDNKKRQIFKDYQDNIVFVKGVIEEISSYQQIFDKQIDVVYHLAAIPGLKWGTLKQEYYKINVEATQNLLKECFGKIKRFIFCSSINAVSSDNFKNDPYGKSKWQAEQIVQEYQRKGLLTVIIRPAIVYGPSDTSGMMLKMLKLIKKKFFYLIGTGNNVIPFVYIDDMVTAFIKALNCPSGGCYEIVGETLSINQSLKIIEETLKVRLPTVKISIWLAKLGGVIFELLGKILKQEPLITKHRIDIMIKDRKFSQEKIKKELGWEPQVNFQEGIKKTINWYQENGYL